MIVHSQTLTHNKQAYFNLEMFSTQPHEALFVCLFCLFLLCFTFFLHGFDTRHLRKRLVPPLRQTVKKSVKPAMFVAVRLLA